MSARTSRWAARRSRRVAGQPVEDDREVTTTPAMKVQDPRDQARVLGVVRIGPLRERLGDRRAGVDPVDEARQLAAERLLRLVPCVRERLRERQSGTEPSRECAHGVGDLLGRPMSQRRTPAPSHEVPDQRDAHDATTADQRTHHDAGDQHGRGNEHQRIRRTKGLLEPLDPQPHRQPIGTRGRDRALREETGERQEARCQPDHRSGPSSNNRSPTSSPRSASTLATLGTDPVASKPPPWPSLPR